MKEAQAQTYLLAFNPPLPARQIYDQAKGVCFREHHHEMEPRGHGLLVALGGPFGLTAEQQRQLAVRIDDLMRKRRLSAVETQLAIGRTREPEDIVYLALGGNDFLDAVALLRSELAELGMPCQEDDKPLHVRLSTRSNGISLELQDLAYGVCADHLCGCRGRCHASVNELLLLKAETGEVEKSWSLRN